MEEAERAALIETIEPASPQSRHAGVAQTFTGAIWVSTRVVAAWEIFTGASLPYWQQSVIIIVFSFSFVFVCRGACLCFQFEFSFCWEVFFRGRNLVSNLNLIEWKDSFWVIELLFCDREMNCVA